MYMTEVDEVVYTETAEYPIESFLDRFIFLQVKVIASNDGGPRSALTEDLAGRQKYIRTIKVWSGWNSWVNAWNIFIDFCWSHWFDFSGNGFSW